MLRSIRLHRSFAFSLALAFIAGCSSETRPARTYKVALAPPSLSDAVILTELIETSGGGDCPQFDPDRTLASALLVVPAGQPVQIGKPAEHSDVYFLGLRFRDQHVRWTIFRAGQVVTTVYPDGRDLSRIPAANSDDLQPTLGWCTPDPSPMEHGPMQPHWPPVGVPYLRESRNTPLTLSLRALARTTQPLPDGKLDAIPEPALPATLTTADAANLVEQLNALLAFLNREPTLRIEQASRRILSESVDQQIQALNAAGLDASWATQLVRRRDALEARLNEPRAEGEI